MSLKFNPITGKFDLVGLTSSTADATYLRLDTTNDPLTGPLTIQDDDTNALLVESTGGTDVLRVDTTNTQVVLQDGTTAAPALAFDGNEDTGIARATISSANRVVLVADGTRTVEYGALGAVTRVPFLFSRQEVAWGASTVDGGVRNVFDSNISEDITRFWPNRDYNAIFITEHTERNRNYGGVWTDDGEPVLIMWGTDNPEVLASQHKYLAIGSDHTNGYARIVTGDEWDLHMQVDRVQFDGSVEHKTTRLTNTDSPYTVVYTDHEIFCDTDGGAITVNLPVGSNGRNLRIINCGSSGNNVTVTPNGAELLLGANSSQTLTDSDIMIITYETTEGWW